MSGAGFTLTPDGHSAAAARGPALARAAEAMLRALGGVELALRFAYVSEPETDADQLGLTPAQTEDVTLSPVLVRTLAPDARQPRSKVELLFAAAAVAAQAELRQAASGAALLESAAGVLYAGRLLRITAVATEHFAGTPYLYRVMASE
jgi:hypothetical protein